MDEQTQPQESKSIPTTTATEARLDEAKGSAKGKDFFKLVFVGFMFFCAGLQSLHYYAMQVTSYKGDDWGIAALFFWGVAGITIIITLVGIFFAKRRLAMLAFTFFGVLTLIPFPLYLENISQASLELYNQYLMSRIEYSVHVSDYEYNGKKVGLLLELKTTNEPRGYWVKYSPEIFVTRGPLDAEFPIIYESTFRLAESSCGDNNACKFIFLPEVIATGKNPSAALPESFCVKVESMKNSNGFMYYDPKEFIVGDGSGGRVALVVQNNPNLIGTSEGIPAALLDPAQWKGMFSGDASLALGMRRALVYRDQSGNRSEFGTERTSDNIPWGNMMAISPFPEEVLREAVTLPDCAPLAQASTTPPAAKIPGELQQYPGSFSDFHYSKNESLKWVRAATYQGSERSTAVALSLYHSDQTFEVPYAGGGDVKVGKVRASLFPTKENAASALRAILGTTTMKGDIPHSEIYADSGGVGYIRHDLNASTSAEIIWLSNNILYSVTEYTDGKDFSTAAFTYYTNKFPPDFILEKK